MCPSGILRYGDQTPLEAPQHTDVTDLLLRVVSSGFSLHILREYPYVKTPNKDGRAFVQVNSGTLQDKLRVTSLQRKAGCDWLSPVYSTLPRQVPLSSWMTMSLMDLWETLSVCLAKLEGIFTGAGCQILGKFHAEVALLVCSLSGHSMGSSIMAASSTICKVFRSAGLPGRRVGGIRQARILLLQDFGGGHQTLLVFELFAGLLWSLLGLPICGF